MHLVTRESSGRGDSGKGSSSVRPGQLSISADSERESDTRVSPAHVPQTRLSVLSETRTTSTLLSRVRERVIKNSANIMLM